MNVNFLNTNENLLLTAKEVLDVTEAAELLRLHPVTVRRMASAGDLPACKQGKSWLFIRTDLLEHLRKGYKPSCYDKEKTACGTPIYPSQEKRVLLSLASQRTKGKRKNITTS
jgi:excisionase family DNA binding protein